MPVKVPRSPYVWCPDCEGAGVTPDANGILTACPTCAGQGRLKIASTPEPEPEPVRAPEPVENDPAGSPPPAADSRAEHHAEPVTETRDSVSADQGPAAEVLARPASRPSPHDYFMGFAAHAATRSKDSTKVGAVLVGPDGEVRLTGYNGPPKGVKDTPDRFERPRKYLFSSHAEQNVVAFAARQGIRTADCTLYVTHHPCSSCARSIIQAGIVCVVVGGAGFEGEWSDEIAAARLMFADAGVDLRE